MNRRFLRSSTICLAISLASFSGVSSAKEHTPPLMVNIPAGEFFMGSESGDANAKPMRKVSIEAFQLGQYPITVTEFMQFTAATGYSPSPTCNDHIDENWLGGHNSEGTASWKDHRYLKSPYQPVTCIEFKDALAYAHWISKKTGINYRLPTEQEWEYAAKGNTTSRFFWGDDPLMTQACLYGNFADHSGEYFASEQYGASYKGFIEHANCDDGEPYISIVGLYRPNPFGLYDIVGNVSQYLATCYYDGYREMTPAQADLSQCDKVSHRGNTWHFPPQPHQSRSRYDREGAGPGALLGFRLASDGHQATNNMTNNAFKTALKTAQTERLISRKKIPSKPSNVFIIKHDNNRGELHWQRSKDNRVVSYDIYQSSITRAHLIGQHFKRTFDLLTSVNANHHKIDLEFPPTGASYLVVARTKNLSSLPSNAVSSTEPPIVSIPGRLEMSDLSSINNAWLAHRKASDTKSELHYISKVNKSLEQPLVTAEFKVQVEKSGWYQLNYRGRSLQTGGFFKVWQNNALLANIDYTKGIDDKVSKRHQLYLEEGTHDLQLTITREGFDYWSLVWLDFSFIQS